MSAPHVKVIAEAGVNHNGRLDLAISLIEAAADAGADAVKFQTFNAGLLANATASLAEYQRRNLGRDERQIDMLRRLELKPEDHFALIEYCRKCNLEFLSSPFDLESLDFLLDSLKLATIKIPSGELTNGTLLFRVGRSGRRAILSTGMANLEEIALALDLLAWGYQNLDPPQDIKNIDGYRNKENSRALLSQHVSLLQCTTDYPANFDTINLRAMDTLRKNFGLDVGLSDHSEGISVPIAGVALGASIIEKHITLNRFLEGPDHKASLVPCDFKLMVKSIREIEQALGDGIKLPSLAENANREIARKSLVAAKAIRAGEIIQSFHLTAMRPGGGLSPMLYWNVLGTTAIRDYSKGDFIE